MKALTSASCFAFASLFVACSGNPPLVEGNAQATDAPPAPTEAAAQAQLSTESLPAPPDGVSFAGGLAASSPAVGQIDLFAASIAGEIWHLHFEDQAFQAWEAVSGPGVTDTALAASSNGPQATDLFYRDAASQKLGHTYSNADGVWQSELLGQATITRDAPAVASSGSGAIDVFTRGANATLLRLSKRDVWAADWQAVAGVSNVGSAPSVTAWDANRLDVFWSVRGSYNLGHFWSEGGNERSEELPGDTLASAPAAVSRGAGLLDVLYVSSSRSSTLVRQFYDEGWDFEHFALGTTSNVASVSWGPGRVDAFYIDDAGLIQHALLPSASVLTQHNDIARSGGNTHEVELNQANVSSDRFGKLFTISVDGNVWAQPLYQGAVDLSEQGQGQCILFQPNS